MPQDRVGEIHINKRLLRIGGQFYPLAHITRVQTLWIEWGPKIVTFPEFVVLLLVIGVGVSVLPELGFAGSEPRLILTLVLIAGIVVLLRLVARKRRFLLLIETAGGQIAVLAAKAEPELQQIRYAVVEAIENPSDQERVLQLSGDIIMGDKVGRDKILQRGSGNSIVSN